MARALQVENAQIARSGPKYMIRDIEGLSNVYIVLICTQHYYSLVKKI